MYLSLHLESTIRNDALLRVDIADDCCSPGAGRERQMFYTNMYHSMVKPNIWTGQVPLEW
jgi:putative alpha-1,2-mannosidase